MGARLRFVGAVSAVALAMAGLSACGAGSSQVVARVSGVPITKAALDHWTAIEAAVDPHAPSGGPPRSRALGLLISSQWTLGQARQLGARIGDGEVRRQTELLKYERRQGIPLERMPREEELARFLGVAQMGLSDQEWVVKLALLDARIEQLRIAQAAKRVSYPQIASYYKHHQARFFVLERREVAIIETSAKPPIEKAKREIQSGKGFADVARRVSEDPRARDGRTLTLASNEGATELKDAIFRAKPHVLTGPLLVIWYYLFEILRIVPAHELSLTQAKDAIVQELARRAVSSVSPAAYEQKWMNSTSCARGYVAPGCSAGRTARL